MWCDGDRYVYLNGSYGGFLFTVGLSGLLEATINNRHARNQIPYTRLSVLAYGYPLKQLK